MKRPIYKKKFEKDVKRARSRGKHLAKLSEVMSSLIDERPLDKKLLDHPLHGDYTDCRECHLEPDWLLIYLVDGDEIIFVRTGSHSDLF